MNKQKQLYEAPTAQTFVVRFEGMVCTSPGAQINDWTDDGDPLDF